MSTQLTYPRIQSVKLGLWTICNKIEEKIGERPGTWSNNSDTHFTFQGDLTQEQKDQVDAIVTSPDAQGPDISLMVQNNSYIISDIWEHRAEIAAQTGINFKVFYRFSGTIPGAKYPDEIVLVPCGEPPFQDAQRILTNNQKNQFVSAIEDLNRWE